MAQKDLAREIVKAMEAGFNRYLNRSVKYSPFRVFYRLFKNANPRVMNYARSIIRDDVNQLLNNIPNFDTAIFMPEGNLNTSGKQLLFLCYKIGGDILRKKLTVVTVFKVMNNSAFRDQIYNEILEDVERNAAELLIKALQ